MTKGQRRLPQMARLGMAVLAGLFLIPVLACAGGAPEEQPAAEEGSGQEGQTGQQSGSGAENPVAVVNGTPISQQDFETAVARNRAQLESQGQSVGEQRLEQLRSNVLESLITQELLYQKAVEEGISVNEGEVDAELTSIQDQFPDQDQYGRALEQAGVSEEQLRSDIERNLAIQKLVQQEISAPGEISEEELRRFYDENPDLFEQGERIQARHILISTQQSQGGTTEEAALEEAREVRRLLMEEDREFTSLAEEYSDGPSAQNGGRLGTFSRGQMVPAFEEAAFDLEVGEISTPVKTQFGYHIIEVTDRVEAGSAPFEQQRERIRRHLTQERQRQMLDDYLAELKDEAEITRNLE